MSDPIKELDNLKNKIKSEKNPDKKDKLKSELELAKKMGKRKNKPAHQELQTIKTQKRFDKNPISKKTDMIGDDKLTADFAKGGRVQLRGGGICKKGMNKKVYGANS